MYIQVASQQSPSFYFIFFTKNEIAMTNKFLFASILTLFLFSSCRKNDGLVISSLSLDEYTPAHNMTIGNAVEAELTFNVPPLTTEDAPEAYEYLQSMLNLVLTTSTFKERETYDWQVVIVPDDNTTATFALPNGHLYIYSGLLKYIETESQLLSLLAHELAYVDKGYVTLLLDSKFGKKDLGDIILDNENADPKKIADAFPTLPYAKEKVREADEFSVEVLCPFVYEPRGIVKMIEKALENPEITLDWIEMRPADNLTQRRLRINAMSDPCGLDGVKNEAEYTRFLETL